MRKWTFDWYRFSNGSRSIGGCCWWDKHRAGVQIALIWVEFYILREF